MSRDACGNIQVEADRWCDHTYLHVDDHDNPQVDRIDPQFERDWKKNRRHDQNNRRRLHEVAGYQQHDVDDDQEAPGRQAPAHYQLGYMMRNSFGGQNMREKHSIGNDKEEHDTDLGGIPEDPARIGMVYRARYRQDHLTQIAINDFRYRFVLAGSPGNALEWPHIAINEDSDNESINRGDGGGLGRTGNAAIDRTQHNNNQHQSPEGD
ncbi:hypothetical protein ES705_46012 [subsurface metagenome]